MARVDAYLKRLGELEGSDLHLSAARPPMLRQGDRIVVLDGEAAIYDAQLRDMLRDAAGAARWHSFEAGRDLDFGIDVEGVGRFRGNYFEQLGGAAAVFRRIPPVPQDPAALGLSEAVMRLSELDAGLVLVTGRAASGRTTTVAALVHLINARHSRHIVSIESPVEFLHDNIRSTVSHREVGIDTDSVASGLRTAMRQDADVIVIGDLRDPEAIELAVEAGGRGALVLATLSTHGAARALDRLLGCVEGEAATRIRQGLASSLQAVISQQLVPSKGGERIAAQEVLLRAPALPGALRDGNTSTIPSIIGSGGDQGMRSMDAALMGLAKAGTIDGHDAYLRATNKRLFAEWAD